MPKQRFERTIDIPYTTQAVARASGNSTYTVVGVTDHGSLLGLGDDDHLIYLLASDAGGRTVFVTKWNDLTDGGDTTLHIHDTRYYTKTNMQTDGQATVAWANVSKTGSNLNEIATRSHTVLSDIGTNTHAQIDTHIATGDTHVAHSGVSIIAGNGLTGGGTIAASRTLDIGVQNTGAVGLTVEADAIRLTSSDNPGATSKVLATNASGYVQVVRLGAGTSPNVSVEAAADISAGGAGRFKGWVGAGNTGAAMEVGVSGGVGTILAYDRTGSVYIPMQIKTSSGNQIYLPIDGNVGLFTTATKTWHASFRAVQLGALGSIMTAGAWSSSYSLHYTYNAYYDGAWKYQYDNPALYFRMGSTGYTWTAAATGTADATAALSAKMSLDLSGNLTVVGSVDSSVQFLGQAADTVAAPSFSWTGDTNTGMLRPLADTIAFSTAGVERVRISATGKVGIGVTPSVGVLDITQTTGVPGIVINRVSGSSSIKAGATDGYIMVDSTGQAAAINYYVADNIFLAYGGGNVGIGNNAPSHKLHVSGDIRATGDLYVDGGMVDFGSSYFEELTDFELRGAKAFSLFQTIKAASWNITTTGTATFVDVVSPSVRAGAATELVLGAGADIQLNPTGVVKLANNKLIRSASFVSGWAGNGWSIQQGTTTAAEFDDLTVRGTMRVYELLIQQIRATNGSIYVTSSAKLASATLVSGSTYRCVVDADTNDYQPFAVGDVIRAQRVNLQAAAVAAGSGTIVWRSDLTVTAIAVGGNVRTFDATLRAGTTAPAAGMEFVRLGSSVAARQGSIYLTADDSGAPFIDVVNGITQHTDWNTAGKVKARFGKLDGLGRGNTDEYGFWAGSGIGDAERSVVASNFGVELNGVPVKFKAGSSTVVMQLDPGAGNAVPTFAMGATLPTGPLVGDGLWMGKDSADYEFRVGTVSAGALTKGLHWDGANLRIVGNTLIGPGTGYITTALLHLKFDSPSTNSYAANLNTHLGSYPTSITGSYRGDSGKFNGGLQLTPANVNYINNPSFEVDTSNWAYYNNGTATRVAGGVSGGYCLSFATGADTSPYMYNSDIISNPTLTTGQVWVFSAYVKAGNAQSIGKTVYIRLRENADGAYLSSTTATLTAEWQRISVTRTLTHASPTTLNRWIHFVSTASSGDVFLVDAIQLENDYLKGYIDGSMANVTWAGTAHASVSTQASASLIQYDKQVFPTDPKNGTLMFWVKPTAKTTNAYQSYAHYGGASGNIIARIVHSTDYWQVYWGATGLSSSASTALYGQWQHIAVTRSGGLTKLYINGSYVGSAGGTELVYHASSGFPIGSSTEPANGVVDEYTLLDHALTADEIAQVYQSGSPLVVPTSNNELSVSNTGLSVVRINAVGISALNDVGDESFVLSNGTMNWGTRYTSGQAGQLTSGDMVLGDPDSFHMMYDASAASVLLGKATEENIVFSSTGIDFKNGSTVWAKIDGNSFTFGKSTDQYIAVSTGGLFFQNGATTVGGISTLGVLILGEYANNKSRMEANGGELKFINRVGGVDTEYARLGVSGILTLGNTASEHMSLSGTALEFKNSTTVLGSFDGTTLVLGQTGATNNNIRITPTSLDIRYGTTSKISLDSSGNASFSGAVTASSGSITGNLSIGSAGTLYSGAAATWQSAGYQLQYNAGTTPRMYIGDGGVTTGDKYLMWDGTNLSFRGANTSLTTAGRFTASDVDITGIITASSGSITGTLTIGASGKITTTNADIDTDGLLVRVGTTYLAKAGYRLNSGATTYSGYWGQIPDANNTHASLLVNKVPDVLTATINSNAYMTISAYAPSATSRLAKTWIQAATLNGSGGIVKTALITLESQAASTIMFEADTVKVGANRILTVADEGTGNGLDADTLDGYHSGSFANASHTHSFTDINGNGNITTTGTASVGSGTDSVNVISRMQIAGNSGNAVLMNNTLTTLSSQYALSQNSVGDTFINAANTKTLYFRINNSSVMTVNASEVAILQPAAFSSWVRLTEIGTAPGTSNFATNTQGGFFIKGDRMYIGFNNNGTMRYYYLDLTQAPSIDAAVSWKYAGTSV